MSDSVVGDYQLLNCIAAGSQTQIWEVARPGVPEHYVMKLMLPHVFQDRDAVRTLRHEAKVGTSLEHPNLVEFHEFTVTGSEAFIVMEYFRGPNLKNSLKADAEGLQTRLRRVMEGACLGLAEIHRHGWVHKDVKPDNILANRAGEVKLIDFALATRIQSGLGKLFGGKPKTIQGTRTYIAPETIRKQTATPATDVYSLGVTLFELLTGTPPFKGSSPNDLLKRHLAEKPDPPSALNPNVTTELDQLVLWMLSKKPENRPPSMTELYQAIRTVPMFREAITPGAAKQEDADEGASIGRQLDSRADAARTASRGPSRPKPKPAAQRAPPPQPRATPPSPASPPVPPTQPQQPYPPAAYPPQPYPQQPVPGQPVPQQPYPQQPYPQQPYPGQPHPQQPYPQQPYPGQPHPQQPYPQQPYPQQGQPPQQPAPQPGQPPVRQRPEDLPPMTELPDVS